MYVDFDVPRRGCRILATAYLRSGITNTSSRLLNRVHVETDVNSASIEVQLNLLSRTYALYSSRYDLIFIISHNVERVGRIAPACVFNTFRQSVVNAKSNINSTSTVKYLLKIDKIYCL